MTMMSIVVGRSDVLCGKGQGFMQHPGNQDFRQWVRERSYDVYDKSDEAYKKRVVEEIIALVERRGGRFLSIDAHHNWYVIDRKKARDKTAQALRDCRTKREKNGQRSDACESLLSAHPIGSPEGIHFTSTAMDGNQQADSSYLGIGNSSMLISSDLLLDSLSRMSMDMSTIFKYNPDEVLPMKRDVLCGSGKARMKHPGNQDFRRWVLERAETYNNSDEGCKRRIAEEVVELVEQRGGRFLSVDSKADSWYVIDRKKAVGKTAQAFRDTRTKRKAHQMDDSSRESPLPFSHAIQYDEHGFPADIFIQGNGHIGRGGNSIVNVNEASSYSLSKMSMDMFGELTSKSFDFFVVPTTHDVLCGSGTNAREHPGNRDVQSWVQVRADSYENSDDGSKNRIVDEIIALVEHRGGRFLCLGSDGLCWYVIDRKTVHDKLKRTFQALSQDKPRFRGTKRR